MSVSKKRHWKAKFPLTGERQQLVCDKYSGVVLMLVNGVLPPFSQVFFHVGRVSYELAVRIKYAVQSRHGRRVGMQAEVKVAAGLGRRNNNLEVALAIRVGTGPRASAGFCRLLPPVCQPTH
jgi:hypothetical protein